MSENTGQQPTGQQPTGQQPTGQTESQGNTDIPVKTDVADYITQPELEDDAALPEELEEPKKADGKKDESEESAPPVTEDDIGAVFEGFGDLDEDFRKSVLDTANKLGVGKEGLENFTGLVKSIEEQVGARVEDSFDIQKYHDDMVTALKQTPLADTKDSYQASAKNFESGIKAIERSGEPWAKEDAKQFREFLKNSKLALWRPMFNLVSQLGELTARNSEIQKPGPTAPIKDLDLRDPAVLDDVFAPKGK